MFNITNQQAKQAYQLEIDRMMTVLETVYIKQWKKMLDKQFSSAISTYESQGKGFIYLAIDKNENKMVKLFKTQYRQTANIFSKKTFDTISKLKLITTPDTKALKDEFWRVMGIWVALQAVRKSKLVNKTLKSTIAKIIFEGTKEKLSVEEIAKKIRKAGQLANIHHAKTIALTETHTAAVKSMEESVKSTKLRVEREWVSARDDRTRRRTAGSKFEHFLSYPAGPNGEKVMGHDERFQKTGEPMAYPGDPSGSIANIARCRCVVLFHTIR